MLVLEKCLPALSAPTTNAAACVQDKLDISLHSVGDAVYCDKGVKGHVHALQQEQAEVIVSSNIAGEALDQATQYTVNIYNKINTLQQ